MSTEEPNSGVGHNSAGQLKAFVERVQRLEEEKANLAEDIKEVLAEAKAEGFDTKALRAVLRIAKDVKGWREAEDIRDLYLANLGYL